MTETQAQPQTQPQQTAEKPKAVSPIRKGFGSILKGAAVLLGGYLGIAAVAGYSLVKGAYNLSKKDYRSGAGYLAESLLSVVAPIVYVAEAGATGAYRVAKKKLLPWDEGYVKDMYG